MYGARGGHLEAVRTLLSHGANPNAPEELADRGGALFAACAANRIDIVELLLQHGADPDAGEDSSGVCVYIADRYHGEAAGRLVELLYEHGAQRPERGLDGDDFGRAHRRLVGTGKRQQGNLFADLDRDLVEIEFIQPGARHA